MKNVKMGWKIPVNNVDPILARETEKLARQASINFDDVVRKMLLSGATTADFGNRKITLNLRGRLVGWIIRNRIALAEWIGGEHLHDNCGDY